MRVPRGSMFVQQRRNRAAKRGSECQGVTVWSVSPGKAQLSAGEFRNNHTPKCSAGRARLAGRARRATRGRVSPSRGPAEAAAALLPHTRADTPQLWRLVCQCCRTLTPHVSFAPHTQNIWRKRENVLCVRKLSTAPPYAQCVQGRILSVRTE